MSTGYKFVVAAGLCAATGGAYTERPTFATKEPLCLMMNGELVALAETHVAVAACDELKEPIYIPKARLKEMAKRLRPPDSWYGQKEEDLF